MSTGMGVVYGPMSVPWQCPDLHVAEVETVHMVVG